jgi:peroxiredoxin Q/BCP
VREDNRLLKWLIVAIVLGLVLLFWRITAAAKAHLPKVGDAAPDFELPDQNGGLRSSVEFLGRWLVLYFYPRDDTPGCTEQAARFRDAMGDIEALGAAVCGVSVDDAASHAAFALKHRLSFALLADSRGGVAARYGSLVNLGLVRFARRNTFLIDPQGRVAKVYLGANPSRNAQDITSDLKRLKPS